MTSNSHLKSLCIVSFIVLSISTSSLQAQQTVKNKEVPAKHKHKQPPTNHKSMQAMSMSGRHNHMRMDKYGMVMNENKDNIPKDCAKISEDVTLKVNAGVKYSEKYPGTVFGYNSHQWEVKPCSRVTVEFTNEDNIRHQWMLHGLPRYLYPQGMFHIEVYGKGKKIGTFILPSSNYTYLVHCDIAQHTEKGMKAQLKVGKGRGDLPSIPGISDPTFPDSYD